MKMSVNVATSSIALCAFVSVGCFAKNYEAEGKACSQLLNQTERLECFDKVFSFSGKSKIFPKSWSLRTTKNAMTDGRDVIVSKRSMNLVKNRFGTSQTKALLSLRCTENRKEFVVSFDTYLSAKNVFVQTRIDDGEVQDGKWDATSNGKAFYTVHEAFLDKFMPQLYGHKKLLFKVYPFADNPFTVQFDITDIQEAYKPVLEACGK